MCVYKMCKTIIIVWNSCVYAVPRACAFISLLAQSLASFMMVCWEMMMWWSAKYSRRKRKSYKKIKSKSESKLLQPRSRVATLNAVISFFYSSSSVWFSSKCVRQYRFNSTSGKYKFSFQCKTCNWPGLCGGEIIAFIYYLSRQRLRNFPKNYIQFTFFFRRRITIPFRPQCHSVLI